MADTFPPTQQKAALQSLAEAINSRSGALHKDECGDYRLSGRRGFIVADAPGSYQIITSGLTPRTWGHTKKLLAFSELVRDGDDEGAFGLDRLPTKTEAESILEALVIHRRRHISNEQVDRLRQMGFRATQEGTAGAQDGQTDDARYDHTSEPSGAEKKTLEMVS